MYNVILALPEIILVSQSWFWKKTVRVRDNNFIRRLHCIAIDETHVIWGWRNFREEYRMLGHLKDVYPTVPTLILSATVTPNIPDYIRVSLKLSPPSRIYRQPLDWPNLKYIVSPIRNPGFQDLAFLVPRIGLIANIPKTMVFVDKIDDAMKLEKFLRSKLPDRVQNGSKVFEVIRTFSSNLSASSRTKIMQDLRSGNTQICICTECAGMGINPPDIMRAVQSKIPDFIALPELLQRLGRGGRDVSRAAVAMVFVDPQQILPEDGHTLESSAFKDLRLPVNHENREQITNVIAKLYRNVEPTTKKTGNAYQKTDPALLWFLNTSVC